MRVPPADLAGEVLAVTERTFQPLGHASCEWVYRVKHRETRATSPAVQADEVARVLGTATARGNSAAVISDSRHTGAGFMHGYAAHATPSTAS
jgi:hypothetical protein